ncbi:hypothetical protein T484DRAFT_1800632 [Baffinella frigidus]|nr:hypothetical protein T484DRAFT_1800632 [Cryptophyta sp. CCMP2293]
MAWEKADDELDLVDQMEGWMDGEFEKEDAPLPQPIPLLPSHAMSKETIFRFEECAVRMGAVIGKEALSTRVWRGALVLARGMVARREIWQGKSVLELGAGMGL